MDVEEHITEIGKIRKLLQEHRNILISKLLSRPQDYMQFQDRSFFERSTV